MPALVALSGLGKLTFDALQTLYLPMLMAAVMYGALLVVAVNALADAAAWGLDPRRRGMRGWDWGFAAGNPSYGY